MQMPFLADGEKVVAASEDEEVTDAAKPKSTFAREKPKRPESKSSIN
jgi:hypothetical protein